MSIDIFADRGIRALNEFEHGSDSFVRANIAGSTHVRIERIGDSVSWDHKVHAINWFNSRFLFVYNFYNFLAARSVKKVGGVPLFKGRLLSQVIGNVFDQRGVLLIVEYPSPKHFRSMLENTYFKLVSVVRALAVQRFTFCLSHVMNEPEFPDSTDSFSYAVHHFRGSGNSMSQLVDCLREANMHVVFCSLKTHELVTVSASGESTPVPALMDGIILFHCADEASLRALVSSPSYRANMDNCETSFVGLFQRIM